MGQKSILLWGFLGFVALAMIGGTIAVLFPRWSGSGEMLGSLILIGLYVLGAMALVMYGKRMPMTRWLCLVGLIVSLAFFLVSIWFYRPLSRHWESVVMSVGGISLALAGGLAHRVFVWPIKTKGLSGLVLKWAAVVFALATVGLVVYGFVTEGTSFWGRSYLRVMWISVILTTGTTIATGAFALFGAKSIYDEPGLLASSIPVSMTCPRCQSTVQAQSNRESRCSSCRLKIRVEVDEPRCGCGYLLYQLESDVCPECGKGIVAADRWRG